jgi:hypothetical protein
MSTPAEIAAWNAAVARQKALDTAVWVNETNKQKLLGAQHQQDLARFYAAVRGQQSMAPQGGIVVPPKQSQPAAALQQEAERTVAADRARADAGLAQSQLTDQFNNVTAPGLAGQLGATGQYYSSAGRGAQLRAAQGYTQQSAGIQSALQRKLADFTRQRTYASLGLII